jgi:uncharacterized membrane-anchored protein
MNNLGMNNIRMWAYAMIATGLINWDYQRASHNVIVKSAAIVLPGAILFALTFYSPAKSFLQSNAGRAITLIIGALALAYAFIN